MKNVGELAIIGVLLKAVKTSRAHSIQGRTYLTKRRLFCWLLLQTYFKHIRPEWPGWQNCSLTWSGKG